MDETDKYFSDTLNFYTSIIESYKCSSIPIETHITVLMTIGQWAHEITII